MEALALLKKDIPDVPPHVEQHAFPDRFADIILSSTNSPQWFGCCMVELPMSQMSEIGLAIFSLETPRDGEGRKSDTPTGG